jgi:hypothetical protein
LAGHWWNRKRIWYYTDAEDIVAPKPHPITIRLAYLAPALAVVAVVMSIASFNTSRQSLETGQRAYLSFVLQSYSIQKEVTDDGRSFITLRTKLAIRNVGNTPAFVDSAFHGFNDVRGVKTTGGTASTIWIKDVSPKEDQVIDEAVPVSEDADSIEYYGTLKWHDVFNRRHESFWCRQFFETKMDKRLRVTSCGPARWPELRPFAPQLP